jgi:hypothetical protein
MNRDESEEAGVSRHLLDLRRANRITAGAAAMARGAGQSECERNSHQKRFLPARMR